MERKHRPRCHRRQHQGRRDRGDGKPICNLAGDVFDPPASREFIDWTIHYTRYEPFFDFITARKYQNSINTFDLTMTQTDGQSMTFPPGTVKLQRIIPAEEYALDATAVKIGYSLQFRAFPDFIPLADYTYDYSPFHIWLKNAGFNGWYSVSGTATKGKIYYTSSNDEIQVVTPLDSGGNPIDTTSHYVGKSGSTTLANPNAVNWPKIVAAGDGRSKILIFKNYPGKDLRELSL